MKYSLHNSRIHKGSIHFSTHSYYSCFCSVSFSLIATKFDRCQVRVSTVSLRVFAFRRSTACKSCFVSFLHRSAVFSTLLTAITCLEKTAAEYCQLLQLSVLRCYKNVSLIFGLSRAQPDKELPFFLFFFFF